MKHLKLKPNTLKFMRKRESNIDNKIQQLTKPEITCEDSKETENENKAKIL